MAIAIALAGCGGGHDSGTARPGSALITTDHWSPPAVAGPPSTAKFCDLLVADYEHLGSLPDAANLNIREQIVSDYVNAAPAVVAAAPQQVAGDARLYIGAVATILQDLDHAGLNPANLHGAGLGGLLLNPRIQRAGNDLIGFSQLQCHYTIGG